MIISHSRKFIFFKTHNTASTSLEIALSKYCAPRDILTPIANDEEARRATAGLGARNYGLPLWKYFPRDYVARLVKGKIPPLFTEHMRAVDARERVGEKIWCEYFKFTIVRNPFDPMGRVTDRNSFMRHRPDDVNENWLTYTAGDEILVDEVVRHEHREQDLARVSARIGLGHNLHEDMRQIDAKMRFRPKTETRLGPEEIAIIGRLCAKEIECFGYAPQDIRSAA